MGNVETKKTPAARGTGRARATRATTVAAGAESSTTPVPAETFRASKGRPLTQFEIDGGLVFKGLIPSRDWDTLGIAASYLRFSDDIRSAVRDANATFGTNFKLPDYEGLLEVSYKAQLTAWWTVQPSIQWVLHPGGRTDLANPPKDAVAFILQTTLRF